MSEFSSVLKKRNGKYRLKRPLNDRFYFKITVTDQDAATVALTGYITTFKIFATLADIDSDNNLLSITATNDTDQTTNKGIATVTITKAQMQTLPRKSYIFEIRTSTLNRSITGEFIVEWL